MYAPSLLKTHNSMREQHNKMLWVEWLKCLAAKVNHQTSFERYYQYICVMYEEASLLQTD